MEPRAGDGVRRGSTSHSNECKGDDMGSLKTLITGDPLHGRSIDMKTYAVDADTILVEGWLREDRFLDVYDITGEALARGPVHHMGIRLLVGGTPPAILDAEAEMEHAPLDICHDTRKTIQTIIGLEIKTGFQKKVRLLMGGEKGCAHLTHLLTVMSQAVFQGAIAHKRRHPAPLPGKIEEVAGFEHLLGSCRAWGKGGPKVMNLKAAIERKRAHTKAERHNG